jgi:hypothetical protein
MEDMWRNRTVAVWAGQTFPVVPAAGLAKLKYMPIDRRIWLTSSAWGSTQMTRPSQPTYSQFEAANLAATVDTSPEALDHRLREVTDLGKLWERLKHFRIADSPAPNIAPRSYSEGTTHGW